MEGIDRATEASAESDYVFPCDKCGICCRSLNKSVYFEDLNDGNGVCIHLDKVTNLCQIYESRPDKCDVVKYYHNFRRIISFEEYINANIAECKRLKGDV